MLTYLAVEDVVLIDRLGLEFAPGFTVVTGETGAGKSMLLDALGLAAGARVDKRIVRAKRERASASAVFDLAPDHPALAALDGADLAGGPRAEDPGVGVEPVSQTQTLILRRSLGRDGRSRAFINDRPCSLGVLRAAADTLIEVHGQHDGRGLMDPQTHRATLDGFAKNAQARTRCASMWRAVVEARARVEEVSQAADAAEADRVFLEDAVARLEELAPEPDEEAALADERRFLQGAQSSRADVAGALAALEGAGGLEDRLGAAARALDAMCSGQNLATAAAEPMALAVAALDKAMIEAEEARAALRAADRALDVDPQRLTDVEERLFALRAAARQHHTTVDGLSQTLERYHAALALVDGRGQARASAQADVDRAQAGYAQAAEALSATRRKAAGQLAKLVNAELAPLKLDKARLRVAVTPSAPGADGTDTVRFEVATNPGADFGPLEQIASGGELSRFALALKVALSSLGGAHVFIFDEIDQGVGGATADAVGRRLAVLAADAQVIVVTHSPQVAARADHHLKIEKTSGRKAAVMRVHVLKGKARRDEIARMLAGDTITDAARAAADTLLDAA